MDLNCGEQMCLVHALKHTQRKKYAHLLDLNLAHWQDTDCLHPRHSVDSAHPVKGGMIDLQHV